MVLNASISIIVPAHNEWHNLQVLIPRLIKVSQGFFTEIIVALSSETSDMKTDAFPRECVQIVTCQKKGRAVQMNTGAQLATGDILVFLHADVVPPELFLEDILKTISNGYQAGFFSYKFDSTSFWLKINARFTASDGIFTGGGDQCLFITKETFQQLGTFNEEQVLMEDFEFFGRMKKAKTPYKIVKNDLLVSARKYDHNSYIKVNFCNLVMVVLFKMGYSPQKLKTVYSKMLNV